MTVIDIQRRSTRDLGEFEHYSNSSDSLIYIDIPSNFDQHCSLELVVGKRRFVSHREAAVPIASNGLVLRSGEFAIIEVGQKLVVPNNAYGMVTGKGHLIFKGILISPAKIDPGFRGALRIGVFNTGGVPVTFKTGETFCSCVFFAIESELLKPSLEEYFPSVGGAHDHRVSLARRILGRWPHVSLLLSVLALALSIFCLLILSIRR